MDTTDQMYLVCNKVFPWCHTNFRVPSAYEMYAAKYWSFYFTLCAQCLFIDMNSGSTLMKFWSYYNDLIMFFGRTIKLSKRVTSSSNSDKCSEINNSQLYHEGNLISHWLNTEDKYQGVWTHHAESLLDLLSLSSSSSRFSLSALSHRWNLYQRCSFLSVLPLSLPLFSLFATDTNFHFLCKVFSFSLLL